MRKHFIAFLGLFIFIMVITPQNVSADVISTGFNNLNKSKVLEYNRADLTDYYESSERTLSKITLQSNQVWYNFYNDALSTNIVVDNKNYAPNFINLYNGGGNIPLCTDKCDLMLSFYYGFSTPYYTSDNNYTLATQYLDKYRHATTNLAGVVLVGTDINDQPKEFYCTSQYVIGTIGKDRPYNKFFVTCPTSNFKSISYVRFVLGSTAIDSTIAIGFNYYVDKLTWEISDYTGTQDGIGGSVSDNDKPTDEEILNSITDDNIDSSFQNQTMNDINSQLASNNVISDLLLLPVRMYQSILNSLGNNSCVAYNLGSLYGTNLQLPCIQVQNYIGNELWTTIDLIFCGMFVLVIRKKFVDIFNNMTNLKNGGNEIE